MSWGKELIRRLCFTSVYEDDSEWETEEPDLQASLDGIQRVHNALS